MPKYINADEMMEDESEAYLNVMGQPLDNATRIVNQAVHIKLQRLLSDAPTEDVQEVRHGHWIEKNLDGFRKVECSCSMCGWSGVENYDSYVDIHDFEFCPYRGAKMDGEE